MNMRREKCLGVWIYFPRFPQMFSSAHAMWFYHLNHFGVQLGSRLWHLGNDDVHYVWLAPITSWMCLAVPGVGRKCDVLTSGRASGRKHYPTMFRNRCVKCFSSFSSARAMCFYHFNHFGVQLCSRLWFITGCRVVSVGKQTYPMHVPAKPFHFSERNGCLRLQCFRTCVVNSTCVVLSKHICVAPLYLFSGGHD